MKPCGAFVKNFHGAAATLSPTTKGLRVVWTLTNGGKATVYLSGGFSTAQVGFRTASGKEVPLIAPHESGRTESVAPGSTYRVTISLDRYFRIPARGSFKITFWNSVWDKVANVSRKRLMAEPLKARWAQSLASVRSRDFVNLKSNALTLKIGANGKLAWSRPDGAEPKALKTFRANPALVGKSALPKSGPVATLSALADAVRRADVRAAASLVDRTPAGRLVLAEIPLAGAINRFCRVVRQRLAFDPAPHLAAAFPSVDELDNTLTRLDLKSLKVRGDRASVAIWVINRARIKWVPGLTLRLRRVKGRWLYSGAAGFHLTEPQLRREQKYDRRVTEIFRALTVRVREGKIKTLADLDRISTAQLGRVNEWYARRPKVAHQK